MALEYHSEHGTPEEVIEIVYPRLIRALGRVQPEFHDDWTRIYQTWDDDPVKRILKLDLVPWPGMSRTLEHGIKLRGYSFDENIPPPPRGQSTPAERTYGKNTGMKIG